MGAPLHNHEATTTMPPRSTNPVCEVCDKEVVRLPGQKGRLPKVHPGCRANDTRDEEEASSDGDELTSHDIVDRFALNYNLGNTVRYILDLAEGDELENLQNAKIYLDREIARREAVAA